MLGSVTSGILCRNLMKGRVRKLKKYIYNRRKAGGIQERMN